MSSSFQGNALIITVVVQRLIPSVETVVLVRRSFIILLRRLDTELQLVATRRMTRTIKGDFCGSKQSHRALGNNRILSLRGASDNLTKRINDNAIPLGQKIKPVENTVSCPFRA